MGGVSERAHERHRTRLAERFGANGVPRLFFAPGRVNLMGAHLDYNGGPVMPMAIDRGTLVAARATTDRALRLASTVEADVFEGSIDDLPSAPVGAWWDYPIGVLRRALVDQRPPSGLDILFGGDLPVGAGLSSSASICVGTAFAADRMFELGADARAWIDQALFGEREFVGVQCGVMDPCAVALGRPDHLLWLDCKDGETEHVPLDRDEVRVAVADSGVRRELARGEFNRRVAECARAFEQLAPHAPDATCLRDVPSDVLDEQVDRLDEPVARRARHVVEEVERTFAARADLRRGDVAAFGGRIHDAHCSLRDLFEVSIPELDHLVEHACALDGVLGARLTGAGFGGCVVVLVRRGAEDELRACLDASYSAAFGRSPHVEVFTGGGGPIEL